MENNLILVEVRLRGEIVRGGTFRLKHRGAELPLNIIFDSPRQAADGNYYFVHCHLS